MSKIKILENMKPERTFVFLFLVMTIAGLSACYPVERDIAYEDIDIALTQYDKDYYSPGEYNYFKEFQTFIVPDTVVHIIEDGVADEISREYDKYIIEQVRSNLLKLGYIEEGDPEANPPDISVTVSATTSEHIVYDWYPYWAWFWVFIKKGAGTATKSVENNYPWNPYYGYGTSYTYTTGTVIMEMIDVSKVNESTQEIPVIWAGVINGAVGGPQDGIKNRLSTGIDRCFNQSPYLFK
jgi:hypothetical protein